MMLTRRSYLGLLALLAMGLGAASPAAASIAPGKAGDFIQTLGDEAIAALTNPKAGESVRDQEFRRLLRKGFAIDGIAKFVLGRYWRSLDAEQRRRYLQVFQELIIRTYAARFWEYNGVTFRVTGERPDGASGRLVESEVKKTEGPPLNVQWRVRQSSEGLKIVDVMVEGVSMAVTQRSEFAAVVQQHGGNVEGLIEDLEVKVRQLSK